MYTIYDIKEHYTEEKRLLDKETNFWVYLYVRKLSFYVTWLCIRIGLTANQVTFISLILGMVGCFFMIMGDRESTIIGAILINLWAILDCVDGNIARVLKKTNKTGWFFDSISGFILNSILLFSIAIGIYFESDNLILGIGEYFDIAGNQNISILIIGCLGSISAMYYALIIETYQTIFSKTLFEKKTNSNNSNSFVNKLINIARYLTGFGFIEPIILIASLLSQLTIVVLFFSFMNVAASIYVSLFSVKKAFRN
jgi:phosphatidylglycerophosphate synthase